MQDAASHLEVAMAHAPDEDEEAWADELLPVGSPKLQPCTTVVVCCPFHICKATTAVVWVLLRDEHAVGLAGRTLG